MKLNTKIKSIDLISSKDKIHFDSEGTFPINYGNNFIDENALINFHSEIEMFDGKLSFSIYVNFKYQRNCGRCLTISNNDDESSSFITLNLNEENDYDINYDDEYSASLVVKYGYAVVGHKAQGGEWNNVIIDFNTHTDIKLYFNHYSWVKVSSITF